MNLIKIKKVLKQRLSPERYAHTLRVEQLAAELASVYAVDPNKAKVAALLHDVSRNLTNKQMLETALTLGFNITETEKQEPKLLHARLSSNIAKNTFSINDPEILNAIEHHTLGRENMTTLEKIIYIADHAEPGREFSEAKKVKAIARHNLDQAVALSTAATIDFLLIRKIPIDNRTIKTNQFYTKKGRNL